MLTRGQKTLQGWLGSRSSPTPQHQHARGREAAVHSSAEAPEPSSGSGFQRGWRPALLLDPSRRHQPLRADTGLSESLPTQTRQPPRCPQSNNEGSHFSHQRGAFSVSDGRSRKLLRTKEAGGEYLLNSSVPRSKSSDVRMSPLHSEGNWDSERCNY